MRGQKSLRNSLITLALQEGNLPANNDFIHMRFLRLLVYSWPWILIPNFYWCMLLSVTFCYESSTQLCSEAIRWTSLLLVRYFNFLLPVFICGNDVCRDDIIPSLCGVRYSCRNSVSISLL